MSEALFYDARVIKVIRAVLRSTGIRQEEDLQDWTQTVLEKCIRQVRASGRPPKDVTEAIKIARRIAKRVGIDELRKRVRRGKVALPATDKADHHAKEVGPSIDVVDKKKIVAALQEVLTEEQEERLVDEGSGVPKSQMAKDDGLSDEALYKEMQRAKVRALAKLAGYGVISFAAIVGSMMALHVGPFGESGDVTKSPVQHAAEQRHLAEDACRARKWEECEKALDRAQELDPDSEQAPQVKKLREAIAEGKRGAGGGER
jgi:DNA-directed RNA polymerase specialized sigma24 family protein